MKGKIEFFITPEGLIMRLDGNGGEMQAFTEKERDLCQHILSMIERIYPEAYKELSKLYGNSKLNRPHYEFLMASRFVRCNFGKFDGLTYDIDDQVMHIEEVACPIRCECPFANKICKPKPLGLTERELAIAKMASEDMTYDEISKKLGISHSTIKNFLQIIRKKLKLSSSKDIAKIIIATL